MHAYTSLHLAVKTNVSPNKLKNIISYAKIRINKRKVYPIFTFLNKTFLEENKVILVDENDRETGTMNKLEAHKKGVLHRAFSIFLFNSRNELLLQKRAATKYHSGNLWTNSCCSHPESEKAIEETIQKRLQEEIGITCPVSFQFTFTYKAPVGNDLTEHEFDHVYFGKTDAVPQPNPAEVADVRYISRENLKKELEQNPDQFTSWLKICFEKVEERWRQIR